MELSSKDGQIIWCESRQASNDALGSVVRVVCEIEELYESIRSTNELQAKMRASDCIGNPFYMHLYFHHEDCLVLHQLWIDLTWRSLYLAEGNFLFSSEMPHITVFCTSLWKLDEAIVKNKLYLRPLPVGEWSMRIEEIR